MLRRLILSAITILSISSVSLAISYAQDPHFRDIFIPISSYDDDPFVDDSVVEQLDQSKFYQDDQGRRMLRNDIATIEEESLIYRRNTATNEFLPFAWNPWPEDLKLANEAGDFAFPDEPRFPLHRPQRGPDGKVVMKDGYQVWLRQDLHKGINTAFEAANCVKTASEAWSQRDLSWGNNGQLLIEAHAFIDFNAFYSPSTKMLFFGILPYRLPGETDIKMFETASSWDFAAHESGHAIEHALKPHLDLSDWSYRVWGESFADQMAMWTSLRDPSRVAKLIETTNGNMAQSNPLSKFGEALGGVLGNGLPSRDAFNNKLVSTTTDEVHDRSGVLTGAMYQLFLFVYREYSEKYGAQKGMRDAGDIMGTFAVRSTDYAPENLLTMRDMVKSYLKVDKELFDYKYHAMLVDEFRSRELLDTNLHYEWLNHEASIPEIKLQGRYTDRNFEKFLAENLDVLGIGSGFGLKPVSVIHEGRFRGKDRLSETIVRVQLTQGRGAGATLLNNHGILVFRANGTLAEWHSPMPKGSYAPSRSDASVQSDSLAVLSRAKRDKLDQHGVPVSLVARPDGTVTAEAHVVRGTGLNAYLEVFTSENPSGKRREILHSPLPPSQLKLVSATLN